MQASVDFKVLVVQVQTNKTGKHSSRLDIEGEDFNRERNIHDPPGFVS